MAGPPGMGPQQAPGGVGNGPLKPPHYKDVPIPKLYDGGSATWSECRFSLRRYLRSRNPGRERLLDSIKALRGKAVIAQDEEAWDREV